MIAKDELSLILSAIAILICVALMIKNGGTNE